MNSTAHVMQYCDGVNWIRIGHGPLGGSGCTSPSGTAGNILYNTDYRVMQHCNGQEWVAWGPVGGTKWVVINARYLGTVGFMSDGSGWGWGTNDIGQLGLGNTSNATTPTRMAGSNVWASLGGGLSTCGVTIGGQMMCTGSPGSIARPHDNGNTFDTTSMVAVSTVTPPNTWVAFSPEMRREGLFACGIMSNGSLWCWGENPYGQIGNNNNTAVVPPTAVTPTAAPNTWEWVDTSDYHSCGLKTDHTAWCWGNNSDGQLGDNSITTRKIPTAISTVGVQTWSRITTGEYHSCGIKTDGTLWCWGQNGSGQLGSGNTTEYHTPHQIGTASWKYVTANASSNHYTCAIKSDNTLWCWGDQTYGALGNGVTSGIALSPVQIGTARWSMVSVTGLQTCGVQLNGTGWCWGDNTYYQLGDGTNTPHSTPNQIPCLNPPGNPGDIRFNSARQVLQYCDGVSWVGVGK